MKFRYRHKQVSMCLGGDGIAKKLTRYGIHVLTLSSQTVQSLLLRQSQLQCRLHLQHLQRLALVLSRITQRMHATTRVAPRLFQVAKTAKCAARVAICKQTRKKEPFAWRTKRLSEKDVRFDLAP